MKTVAVVVAAGVGKRFGSSDKVFINLAGKPVFICAIEAFEESEKIDKIFLVTRKEKFKKVKEYLREFKIRKVKKIIEGGQTRQDSVYNALKVIPSNTDIVLVHDAARPLLSKALVERVINSLTPEVDGVIPVQSLTDTIKWVKKRLVGGTINRDTLRAVQTPQAFWFQKLKDFYDRAYTEGYFGTDDASIVERYGGSVLTIEGEGNNIKITTKEDLKKAEILKTYEMKNLFLSSLRIGIGFDSHRFIKGRKLIIGGVEIPYHMGLDGHSDADVLVHAIIDSILGAAEAGDIGTYFPDTDPKFKDISSMILLEKTLHIVASLKVKPLWIDCIIFAEKPKMSPYIPKMKDNLKKLGLNVNIKAKTAEGIGFVGKQEGIAAQAVCLSIISDS
ncbi:MAG: 2-C-methyl-D-erythritol 4-phosphate cytidylyltransferase [Thermodesulfovibrionaceae bacterium]